MTTPFSLRIFVADGDEDGLRLVERSNWVGTRSGSQWVLMEQENNGKQTK